MTKAKNKSSKFLKKLQKYSLPITLATILFVVTILTYQVIIKSKYYPRTLVGSTNVSFLTEGQAIRKLQTQFDYQTSQKLNFSFPQGTFEIDLATSSAKLDYSALTTGFEESHMGTFLVFLQKQIKALFLTYQITPNIYLNLDKQIDQIQSAVEKPAVNAQLVFDEITTPEGTPSSRIQIKEGVDGVSLDRENLAKQVTQFILTGKYNQQLPLKSTSPKVTTEQLNLAKQALENIAKEPIKLEFNPSSGHSTLSDEPSGSDSKSSGQVWTLDTKQLLTLLDLENGSNSLLDKETAYLYIEKIAAEINQEVQEGLFEFNPTTKRVSAFKQSLDGRKLDTNKTYTLLTEALANGNTKNITLPVDIVKPKIQTQDVNSLGINELIGQGISHFAGSIPNRIYNVSLTASKINGVLVPPGQIFSFNQTVGDISAATGFKQAYVIKEGRTVLDDGGGVCQDSTTLFRAVLNAGLPVIKRTAHAYRVGYYEQGFPPGLDATIFYPSVDFQFKNDTATHILIQAYTAGTTLYVDLYGTKDGREVSMTNPIVSNITPAPPDLRQDDPSLPKGTIKQVDFAARGATVAFKRSVSKNGIVLFSENWISNYKAWQAVYLVGTQ